MNYTPEQLGRMLYEAAQQGGDCEKCKLSPVCDDWRVMPTCFDFAMMLDIANGEKGEE